MLTWTPKMWHMRAQRRHYVNVTTDIPSHQPKTEKSEPLAVDYIQHKRHFSNTASSKSNGLRAYFGYD